MARVRIGEMLVAQGAIDGVQLASALAHQQRWGGRLGACIVGLGFLGEEKVLRTVGAQLGVPFLEIGDRAVPSAVLRLVPEKLIRARRALPLARVNDGRNGAVVVALADPGDLRVLDELAFATGLAVRPVLAAEDDLERAIARLLDGVTLPRAGFQHRPDALELSGGPRPLVVAGRGERDETVFH